MAAVSSSPDTGRSYQEYGRASYSAYGHTADTLYEEAATAGYAVCDLFGNVFRSIDEWRACVDRLWLGLFADPRERLEATAVARADIARRAVMSWAGQARLLRLAQRLPVLATAIERRLKRLA